MAEFIQVFTTVGDRDEAELISRTVVEEGIAACGQIMGPVSSIYRWEGKVESSVEWLVIFKTVSGNYNKIEQAVRRIHSYDVPEIIAVPVIEGSREYLSWLSKETLH
ncbi:MAG: divalent-cation tolerance protein CutA [Actinobacteria bacterium]|nr:divalent-cation tolerance protein CutA [Actinomycetota bacterium]